MDKQTMTYLEWFSQRYSLSLIEFAAILNTDPMAIAEPIRYLRDAEFIRIEPNYNVLHETELQNGAYTLNTPFVITYKGKSALTNAKSELKKFKHNETRAWITAGVAVVALIVSIVSLLVK